MKKYLLILLLLPAFFSCDNGEKEKMQNQIEQLKAENKALQSSGGIKDSTINSYIASINEIEDNLDVIKQKQHIISMNTVNGEVRKSRKDQIVDEIKAINDLMIKNKKRIAYLENRLRRSNHKNAQLEKMIAHLTEEITEKDNEINSLKDELAKTNASLKTIFQQFNDSMVVMSQQTETINKQAAQLNTAYYAYGSAKELKKEGVVTKEGSFIGMGGAEVLKQDFNKKYFTKIDINKTTVIPLYSKEVKLVTTHPSSSYKIIRHDKVDTLKITDPKAFWGGSRYLVIVVKNKHA